VNVSAALELTAEESTMRIEKMPKALAVPLSAMTGNPASRARAF
jgi:hypothetical protein